MTAQTRQVDFISVKSVFTCPSCDHAVTLNKGGALGVYFAVGLLATAILSFLLWGSRGGYDLANGLKTLGLLAVFTSPVWGAFLKSRAYPVTGMRLETETEKHKVETGEGDALKKGVVFMERQSPYKAFLIVLLCAGLFIGAAAMIGWINFTLFEDQLFG